MATNVHIRVQLLSTRAFVARFSTEIHHRGRQTEHHKFIIVIPTATECCSYELVESISRPGFYSVIIKWSKSQHDFFKNHSLVRPIARLDNPKDPNNINEFRARILNTKHLVAYQEVGSAWCCKDWVIDVLRGELHYNAPPRHKLQSLIQRIQADAVNREEVCASEGTGIHQPLMRNAVCVRKPISE